MNFMIHFLSWKEIEVREKVLFGSKIFVWPCSTLLRLFPKLPSPVRQKYYGFVKSWGNFGNVHFSKKILNGIYCTPVF